MVGWSWSKYKNAIKFGSLRSSFMDFRILLMIHIDCVRSWPSWPELKMEAGGSK